MELDSTTYEFAKNEFKVETLEKQLALLQEENAKLQIYKNKWESMVSLTLKLQEASQTIYAVENMVMGVGTKLTN